MLERYAKLSRDADLRERRAKWKVRRSKLDDARREAILSDDVTFDDDTQDWVSRDGEIMPATKSPERKTWDLELAVVTAEKLRSVAEDDEEVFITESYSGSKHSSDVSQTRQELTHVPQVKQVSNRHVGEESVSVEYDTRSNIKTFENVFAGQQSHESGVTKSHIKTFVDRRVGEESSESVASKSVRTFTDQFATRETASEVSQGHHIRLFEGQYAAKESDLMTAPPAPIANPHGHVSHQSVGDNWDVKPRGEFGHSSDQSKPNNIERPLRRRAQWHVSTTSTAEITGAARRMKVKDQHVNIQSDFFSYQVKRLWYLKLCQGIV